jgi:hypothetical protein
MSPPLPHDAPAVLTWRHASTSSSAPRTARHRPMQTVGRGLRGSCCSSGDAASGFVRSRKNQPNGGHHKGSATADTCDGHWRRHRTLGSTSGTCHAACRRLRYPTCHGVGRLEPRSRVEVLAPRLGIACKSSPRGVTRHRLRPRYPGPTHRSGSRPAHRPALGETPGSTTGPATEPSRGAGCCGPAGLGRLDSLLRCLDVRALRRRDVLTRTTL